MVRRRRGGRIAPHLFHEEPRMSTMHTAEPFPAPSARVLGLRTAPASVAAGGQGAQGAPAGLGAVPAGAPAAAVDAVGERPGDAHPVDLDARLDEPLSRRRAHAALMRDEYPPSRLGR
jgi:hypothetical protein